jgi:hypothetical protein
MAVIRLSGRSLVLFESANRSVTARPTYTTRVGSRRTVAVPRILKDAFNGQPKLVRIPGDRGLISLDALQHELPDQMGTGRQQAFEVAVGPHVYSECTVCLIVLFD